MENHSIYIRSMITVDSLETTNFNSWIIQEQTKGGKVEWHELKGH
jgi:hypothetical protein